MSSRAGDTTRGGEDAAKAGSHAATRTDAENGSTDLGSSPSHISDPRARQEFMRAAIWAVTIGALVLTIYISSALLALFGAMVFASMIDGGARLLGRVLPMGRGGRVGIVLAAATDRKSVV